MARELWALRGAYWQLPIGVDWIEGDSAAVRVGWPLQLIDVMRSQGLAMLQAAGASRVEGRWVIARQNLEKVAVPCLNEEPQLLVEWKPTYRIRFRKPMRGQTAQDAVDRDLFFHEFIKTGWLRRPLEAETLYAAFCRHMLHWLLNEQRSVDLGFCRLHAVPFRPNWKEVLRATRKSLFERCMRSGELTMWKGHNCVWTIEVEYTRTWWNDVLRCEHHKRARRWEKSRYLHFIAAQIIRLKPTLRRIYGTYISILANPFVVLRSSRPHTYRAPDSPGQKRGEIKKFPTSRVFPRTYDVRTGQTYPEGFNPYETVGTMPGMPCVPSDTGDLRPARENLREFKDWRH